LQLPETSFKQTYNAQSHNRFIIRTMHFNGNLILDYYLITFQNQYIYIEGTKIVIVKLMKFSVNFLFVFVLYKVRIKEWIYTYVAFTVATNIVLSKGTNTVL
jgi:hypothetical protein